MILVVDVGTSSVRAAVVTPNATIVHERRAPLLPSSPAPGIVEFDAAEMAQVALDCARAALADAGGKVDAVGVTNQRSSVVVWDEATSEPVAPGIGWQDLRTVGRCLELRAETGLLFTPNVTATKLEWLLDKTDRTRDLCAGTVDTWLVWMLTEGAVHVTDATNAAVTGLLGPDLHEWSPRLLDLLHIPESVMPRIVDSTGVLGPATSLPGAPPVAGLAGDQQASLLGQGGVRRGDAKITFGTGAMLDVVLGAESPPFTTRGPAGTYPVVARREDGRDTWALEAVMLTAGTNVEWLCEDLGVLTSVAESHEVAAQCEDTGDVWYVPALLGLGTPHWDYGARGTFVGLTRGTERPQFVRAVLEGIAHRGADLVEAAEADAGLEIATLRVDGGMVANPTFGQALADASGRPVEIAPVVEATALGAAFLAGLAVGTWRDTDELAATWAPRTRVEPQRALDRDRWRDAVERARHWVPELSAVDL
jgi:glycerol kinase